MKRYLFVIIALIFYGCGDSPKESELIEAMIEKCEGKSTVEYTKGTFFNSLKVICVVKDGTD